MPKSEEMSFGGGCGNGGSQNYQIITKKVEDTEIHINAGNKDELEQVVMAIVNNEVFGDETQLNAVMFKGLPGTGKTYTAHWMRTEVSGMMGVEVPMLFVGSLQTPEDVTALYNKARELAKQSGRCIIFDDEVDKYGKRGEIQDSTKEAVLNQILMEMQSTNSNDGVITICCTNRPDKIDSAYRRGKRCGKEITFDPLDLNGRKHIGRIEAFRRNHQFIFDDEAVDYIAEETYGAVGADISQLVTDITTYANLELYRSLKSIAEYVLFSKSPDNGDLIGMFEKLPLANLTADFNKMDNLISAREDFMKKQKDIEDGDEIYQTKMIERYARDLFRVLNPNDDFDKPKDSKKKEDDDLLNPEVNTPGSKKEATKWIKINKGDIDHVLEHFVPSALKDMPFEETKLTFDSFGGLEGQKAYLQTIIENTIAQDREGTAVFLYGGDGCGVTSFARAVAGQYGYNLIVLYGADQESKWVGEIKDRLIQINDRAKASKPTIVVFDNIRYLAQQQGDQSYKQAATGTLKSIIKPTKGVIYIATGYSSAELSPSMRNLFKKMIPITPPEKEDDYVPIWQRCMNPDFIPKGAEIDYKTLSALCAPAGDGEKKMYGLRGGDVDNICRTFVEMGVAYTQKKLEKAVEFYKQHLKSVADAVTKKEPIPLFSDIELSRIILAK